MIEVESVQIRKSSRVIGVFFCTAESCDARRVVEGAITWAIYRHDDEDSRPTTTR